MRRWPSGAAGTPWPIACASCARPTIWRRNSATHWRGVNLIHLLGDVAVFVAATAATLFCLLYHVTAPWRRSQEGWHLMSFTALHALVFGWIAFRIVTASARPLPSGQEEVRTTVYVLAAMCLIWRLFLLYRRQIGPGLRRRTKP